MLNLKIAPQQLDSSLFIPMFKCCFKTDSKEVEAKFKVSLATVVS